MIVVISPAKTLDFETPLVTDHYTQPAFIAESSQLVAIAKKLSPAQLASLMKISDKLAHLNVERFNSWQPEFNLQNARPAILAFKGDVYTGLQAEQFNQQDMNFAQQHLRILSGLYGLLKPLDLMQPYRLEMGTRLANPHGDNLYQFWGSQLTEQLNQALNAGEHHALINLASDEYFKAIQADNIALPVIKPVFLDEKNGKFKVISFHAKKARGLMSRYIIQQRITKPSDLRDFNLEGYRFSANESGANELVFKRAAADAV